MTTYAIGDIQGCYDPLQQLLEHIQFDPNYDTLWFTGDIVNRGPHSLRTLRFVKALGKNQRMVLGNHDLHLLAVASGIQSSREEDTFTDILQAPDRDELVHWLSSQALLIHDYTLQFTMVHAGLAPHWDLETALALAREVETVLQNKDKSSLFFQHMYGNYPDHWSPTLTGYERWRCITNYLTRARFCHRDGRLELKHKGKLDKASELIPWFRVPHRANKNLNIIFGHWAALGGETGQPHTHALDTGCVWGNCLTAMRLSDQKRFRVSCDHSDTK